MQTPPQLRYTAEHLWLRDDGDGVAIVGITDFAQEQLGEIVYVDLPDVGATVTRGEPFGVVESVKAVSDLFPPLTGEVVARNDALDDAPETVNAAPYAAGWMLHIRPSDPSQLADLIDAAAYEAITSAP